MPRYQMSELLRMPWSFVGPRRIVEDDSQWWEIRIRELPGFLVAGESRDEVMNDLREGLQSFLASYLDHGDEPPIPERAAEWRVSLVKRGPPPPNPRVFTVALSSAEATGINESLELCEA